MSVIQIQEAHREGARGVIAVVGVSGSGKTRTAIELAFGMANFNSKKVGLLCTENRRGRLYSDVLKNEAGEVQRFMVGDMAPPYSPQRFIEAIRQFEKAGVEVLIIDSGSHEWEGTGGCEEIANPPGVTLKTPRWNEAKREHKRFMNALLQCDMHVIVCLRAREKVKFERDGKVTPLGIQPICEKNFMFEVTASLMMWNEGTSQEVIKCPGDLRPYLARGEGYITAQDGAAIRAWFDGGVKLDPEVERARNMLLGVTEGGVEAYRVAFEGLSRKVKKALVDDGTHDSLKRAAADYDLARDAARSSGDALAEALAGA